MTAALGFSAAPGRLADAGGRAALLADLPQVLGSLCRAVQGLMVHIFWADPYGLRLDDARCGERCNCARWRRTCANPGALLAPGWPGSGVGEAWRLFHSGAADPESIGKVDIHGPWFVRGELVRDLAALNKVDLLPWDCSAVIERRDGEITEGELAPPDGVGALTGADVPQSRDVAGRVRRPNRPAGAGDGARAGSVLQRGQGVPAIVLDAGRAK